jgi:hypothetical protein
MTNELLAAAEKTFHAAGAKPKNIGEIISKLEAEHQVTASVDGGLLTLTQNGTPVSTGTVLSAYRQKNPRDFYGEAGSVNFKSDLAGDNAAKARFISEHSLAEWEQLPYDAKSPGANKVVTDAIPLASMTCAEYLRLSVAEKSKLAGEIGVDGIQRIMARKRK